MNKKLSALLLLTIWLGACTSSPTTAPAASTDSASQTESAAPAETAPAESAPTEKSDQVAPGREAVLSEFENEVTVRATADGEFAPATSGFVIQQGGALQTGENGRARLDLTPDGTILRVAPNSAFTLPQISEEEGKPKTTLNLFFGKIFVLLNGGSLDVQTPSGVASVRGSLLSVSYDPQTNRYQAACLEGHCSLQNENGEEVELEEGESAYVDENGQVIPMNGIDRDEVQEWIEQVPEISNFMETPPNPEDYPQIPAYEEYQFDPSLYYDQGSTGDGSGYWVFDESAIPSPTSESGSVNTGSTEAATDTSGSQPAPTDSASGGNPTQDPGTPDPGATDAPTQDPTGGGG